MYEPAPSTSKKVKVQEEQGQQHEAHVVKQRTL